MVRNAFTAATPRMTGLTDRTFGVELEIGFKAGGTPVTWASVKSAVLADLAAAGIEAHDETYNHVTKTWWKFVPDQSIGYTNIELVSPILKGEAGLVAVETVCRVLKAHGVYVNETMGLHVHHGAADLSVEDCKVLARLVTRFRPIFDGLLPPTRRANPMCGHFTTYELAEITRAETKVGYHRALSEITRYRALNFNSLARHGTVEFRQHSGSFDAAKITGWILLTQGLVEKAKNGRGRKLEGAPVAANGDGLSNLLRAAGLRTCLPHGQKVSDAAETRARATCALYLARAKKFGVINLAERSETRSRARRTAAEAVAAAVAPVAVEVATVAVEGAGA